MTPAKGYTEMKDSGIHWMGKIPKHWDLVRAKFHFAQTNNRGNENPILLAASQKYGVCPQSWLEGVVQVSENTDLQQFKTVHKNDFVISLRSFQGGFERSDFEGVCSPAYQVFHADNAFDNKYLKYLFKNELFIDEMNSLTVGIREGRNIKYEDFANSLIFVPPLSEQSAIASYLDAQCAKIDAIIAQAKASIEDYKQWKASIIYEAVTKGLDPNVEMKDSGIEWIPLLPTTVKVSRVGMHFSITLGKMLCPKPLDDTYTLESYFCAANVHFSGVDAENLKEMWFNSDEKERYRVTPGDLLVVEGGAGAGGCAVIETVDFPVYIQNSIMIVRPKSKNNVKYLKYFIEALVGRGYVDFACNKATIPHFTKEKLSAVPFPVFDGETQGRIVDFLDSKCGRIDDLIFQKQSLIDDLESYKKSLIYEVVTGKRQVEDVNEIIISILSPEVLRYRKALLMLRVLDLLGDDTRGRIQLQKCMFAAECLLNMPFHTQFIRYEHGPYDPELLNLEAILSRKGWYTVLKGSPVTYQKGKQFEEGLQEYMSAFSDIDLKLEKIVEFLKPMRTSQAERVATLLAVWNDFIIDGIPQPTDKEIIGEVLTHWTPNKANPQYSTWQDTLYKMRENQFVPKGAGVHTLQKK